MFTVKFCCDSDKVIPFRKRSSDAGFDLYAKDILNDYENNLVIVSTGVSIEIPEGSFAMLVPRSSIYKYKLLLANSTGIIDSEYRGIIKGMFYDLSDKRDSSDLIGVRLLQLVFPQVRDCSEIEFIRVDNLTETSRGCDGFGSTGI